MSVSTVVTTRGMARARLALNRLSHLDTRNLLDNIGQLVENQVRRRITQQEGPPEGGAWDEYSDSYKARKKKAGKLGGKGKGFLRLRGHLLDSIQHLVGHDEVEIGSNLAYAGANQAMRPYLGLSDENEDEVEQATADWLRSEMGVII
jgi:phage gpG-like protein